MAEVDARSSDSSEEEEIVCDECGSMPCEWLQFGNKTVESINSRYRLNESGARVDSNGVLVMNALMRKAAFKVFTYLKFGHLGRGHRIPIPGCVMDKVREEYPEANGEYLGVMNKFFIVNKSLYYSLNA